MFKNMGLQFKISLSVGIAVFTILSVLVIYTINESTSVAYDIILKELKSETRAEANSIENQLSRLQMPIDGLGHAIRAITTVNGDYSLIEPILDDFLKDPAHKMVTKVLVNFDPSYINFNLESSREGNKIDTYNNVLNTEWYTATKKTLAAYTTDMYKTDNGWEYIYSMPILVNKIFVGVIAIEVSSLWIANTVADIVPFGIGSAYVVDNSGRLIGVDRRRDAHLLGINIYDSGWSGYKERDFINVVQAGQSLGFKKPSSTFQSGWLSLYQLETISIPGGKHWGLVLQVAVPQMLEDITNMKIVTIIGSIIAFIVLIIFIFMIIRHLLIIDIKKLNEQAKYLASGDLSFIPTKKILHRRDEIGMLAQNFSKIKNSIKKTMTLIDESAKEMKDISLTLSAGTNDLSHRTEEQSSNIERTSANMEEMSSTIKMSAEYSVDGNNMMIASEQFIKKAAEVIEDTAKNVEDVYEASSKIADITKMIESIAFQTNILALNAAVEAARAGEQGRGFAVVASEVRNLALTTQNFVNDISKLIDDSNKKIKIATETSKESKEIFSEIQSKIKETANIMKDMSSTAVEQKAGVDQINDSIIQISDITQQNAALSEELSSTGEMLLSQANNLVELIRYFKINDK